MSQNRIDNVKGPCSLAGGLLLYAAVLAVAAGCATTTKIARNPNIDLNNVRKIAVIPFAEGPAQARISGEWQTLLTSLGYRVVERGDVSLLLKEHGFALSGLVNPKQSARIGEILGVDGIVVGRAGSKPYISYNMMSRQKVAEPPPLSVKLIDAKSARVMWSVTSKSKGEHSASILRQGNAVDGKLKASLTKTLRAGNWKSFPRAAFTSQQSALHIAFNPAMRQSATLRIGAYPFSAESRKQGELWADKMSNVFLNAGYDVIDRVQLETLMKEQKFSFSGVVKPEQMAELGKIAGIQGLVFGAVYGGEVCAYAVRLADLSTGELYWSAFGEGCELDALSGALESFLSSSEATSR